MGSEFDMCRYGQLEQLELDEQELHPHQKNGKHPVWQSLTNNRDVLHEQSVIDGTSSHTHHVVHGVVHGQLQLLHQFEAQGSRIVKHRDRVPTEVSTISLYSPAGTAMPFMSSCIQLPCQNEEDTGASCITE
jgi:hypothetical protein